MQGPDNSAPSAPHRAWQGAGSGLPTSGSWQIELIVLHCPQASAWEAQAAV